MTLGGTIQVLWCQELSHASLTRPPGGCKLSAGSEEKRGGRFWKGMSAESQRTRDFGHQRWGTSKWWELPIHGDGRGWVGSVQCQATESPWGAFPVCACWLDFGKGLFLVAMGDNLVGTFIGHFLCARHRANTYGVQSPAARASLLEGPWKCGFR